MHPTDLRHKGSGVATALPTGDDRRDADAATVLRTVLDRRPIARTLVAVGTPVLGEPYARPVHASARHL
ncbi:MULTISPECIES: hypothetical protein [unclassified Kitasatospora]|uniref:hypothetical protein n=1 Tax=unclassified Kitasatospora TaxID=2633591 RepID=UPI0033FC2C5A